MFRTRPLMALLFLASLAGAAAQKPSIPGIGETIEVSIVNVDVFVTSKAGQRVHGLTQDDFEIFENGVKQPITNFAEYASPSDTLPLAGEGGPERAKRVEGPGEGQAAPPQKRTIIVFVERFYLPKFRTETLFASIKKLLHESIRPGDRTKIVSWNKGVLVTEQDFTTSLPELDIALDRIAEISARPMLDPTAMVRWEHKDGSGDPYYLRHLALQEKSRLQKKVRSINGLIRSIAADEGKKVMLLATHRLSLYAGAEYYYAVGSGPVEGQELDMQEELQSIGRAANANGVTVYPVYPEGLLNVYRFTGISAANGQFGAGVPYDADYLILNNETPALRQIADATGGMTAWGGDDVEKLLRHLRDDLDSYYSLAYRVRSSGADTPRKIVVKAKNRALTVRSRRQFIEKSDVTRMEDRVIAALFGNSPSSGFPLQINVGQRRSRGKQFVIPVSIEIPISALTALPSGNQYGGAFSVYFAWGGMVGGIGDTMHDTKTYSMPAADIEKARKGHFTYDFELAADTHMERVAIGVLDEVSKEYAVHVIEVTK